MAEFIHQAPVADNAPAPLQIAPVPALSGWHWYDQAWQLYLQQPATWTLIMLGYFGLAFAFGMVPFIGSLIFCFLGPVLVAGMFQGVRAQASGEPIGFSVLWRGFESTGGKVVLLTLVQYGVYLAFFIGIAVLALIVQLSGVVNWEQLFMDMGATVMQLGEHPDLPTVFVLLRTILLTMLALVIVLTPLVMLFFFTLPLIALFRSDISTAMKLSFSACVKNWAAIGVYLGVTLLATIVLVLIFVSLAFAVAGGGAGAIGAGLVIGGLALLLGLVAIFVLVPYLMMVMYCAVRDMFIAR